MLGLRVAETGMWVAVKNWSGQMGGAIELQFWFLSFTSVHELLFCYSDWPDKCVTLNQVSSLNRKFHVEMPLQMGPFPWVGEQKGTCLTLNLN